jgi:hypothetical protein
VSATACFAVGSYTAADSTIKALAERWNGSVWSVVTIPDPTGAPQTTLAGVSCASASYCIAVGSFGTDSAFKTLTERWDGTSWAIAPSPHPTGATYSPLSAVACSTTTNCFAVGTTNTNVCCAGHALIEHWNGTTWTIVNSANPGTNDNGLESVSCPSTTSCFAGGSYYSTSNKTLIEHWNGSTWSTMASPNPTTPSIILSGISCSTTTNCYAVAATTAP